MTFHHDNIVSVLSLATPTEHAAGLEWYPYAHSVAAETSPDNIWRGAGVLAAYSPQTPWDRNEMQARLHFATGMPTPGTLRMNSGFAHRIYRGEHPLSVLNGRKTRAFTSNIAHAGNNDKVTVDVHAFSIAQGTPIPSSKMGTLSKSCYEEIAQAYREVALSLGYDYPSQVQAITWVAWRNRINRKGEIVG